MNLHKFDRPFVPCFTIPEHSVTSEHLIRYQWTVNVTCWWLIATNFAFYCWTVNYYFNASSVTQNSQSSCAANTIRLCYDELRSQLYVIPSVVFRPIRVVVSNTGRFTCILAVSRRLTVASVMSTDSSLLTSITLASLEHCWDSLFNTNRLRGTLLLASWLVPITNALRDLPLTLKMKLL